MELPSSTAGANRVTTGSPERVVLRLAMPTVLAMLAQSAVNEIDLIFLSWLPCPESSNAQAALLPSLILLWMFGGSLSAISVGTQALAARRFAEKRASEAGAVLANSWVFSLLAGITFTVLGYLSIPLVLPVLIQVEEVREAARSYLNWRLLGITSMAMTFSFKAFFDGIGRTLRPHDLVDRDEHPERGAVHRLHLRPTSARRGWAWQGPASRPSCRPGSAWRS